MGEGLITTWGLPGLSRPQRPRPELCCGDVEETPGGQAEAALGAPGPVSSVLENEALVKLWGGAWRDLGSLQSSLSTWMQWGAPLGHILQGWSIVVRPGKAKRLCAHVSARVIACVGVSERLPAGTGELKGLACVTRKHCLWEDWRRTQKRVLSNVNGGPRRGVGIWLEEGAPGRRHWNREEWPRHCSWGRRGRNRPHAGWGEVISQRVETRIMAKQPETSYCWGPISQ